MWWFVMLIFLFQFYNFIKGIVHIYIAFFKTLGPLFLYLNYELVQIFITFNRTDVSLLKQVNKYVWKNNFADALGHRHIQKDFHTNIPVLAPKFWCLKRDMYLSLHWYLYHRLCFFLLALSKYYLQVRIHIPLYTIVHYKPF